MLVGRLGPRTGAIHQSLVQDLQQSQQSVVAAAEAGTTTTQKQVDREADSPTHPVPLQEVEPLAKDFQVAITRVTMQLVVEVELLRLEEVEMHHLIEQVTGELAIRLVA
jgi:hypothetical protein